MAFKFDIQKFVLAILFSLILITILSVMISNYTDIAPLKTGGAFILVSFGVFITLLFSVAKDFKVEKGELVLLVFVVVALIGGMWAMKTYFPQIFSIFPESTKQVFSAVIP